MDHLQKFTSQIRNRLLLILLLNSTLIVAGWYAVDHYLPQLNDVLFASVCLIALVSLMLIAWTSARYLAQPVRTIWEAVLHISPETANTVAPDIKKVHLGHELVTSLIGHINQIASVADDVAKASGTDKKIGMRADFLANSLPLPVVVLDHEMNILFANEALRKYVGREDADTVGQNVYLVLDMLFSSQNTFDSWLERVRTKKVTATHTWERVRLNLPEKKETRLFDLVAYYNQSNPEGNEIILTLFDRTRQYSQDEQAMGFLALAVHELRTPLTLLRGYIDVFDEELDGKLSPELTDFMRKMKATAQQLTAFIGNVLNVARFENDQLILKLREEKWTPLLQSAIDDVRLRADVRGVKFTVKIDDNLPTVGADAVSIYEVVNNLLDNAIKYSRGDNKEVVIKSYLTSNGEVETTIQDFGVGIPESAMGNLFEKFYRDYRNRTQVGGTGMGLYLSKAIITAHSGHIWVRSKEGQGTTFGFTLTPYNQIGEEKKGAGEDVTRTAHGWIKNHSMYRR
jgi:signal transduction histidine kinase